MSITLDKAVLRRRMRAARAELLAEDPALHAAVGDRFLAEIDLPPGACIAGYYALPGELDLADVLFELHRRGHPLGLPVVETKGEPLVFRAWIPGDPLTRGSFGVMEPTGPAVVPDLVIVPLLAFDHRLQRLGYGGGYYDRTLRNLDAITVGYALELLKVDHLPTQPFDVPLGAIVTEERVRRSASTLRQG